MSEKEPKPPKIPPRIKSVELLTLEECTAEGQRIYQQFVVLHNLPKIGDQKATEYMYETFEVLRNRCIELNNHSCALLAKANQKRLNTERKKK